MAKYLDASGVGQLWNKVKELVGGIKLPKFKTINGQSIEGEGDITIDFNIYQVVSSLPSLEEANPNKIYLVLNGTSGEQNLYTEYAKINNAWEKLGEYKADVDLTPYLKKEDIATEVAKADFVTFNDVVTTEKNGVLSKGDYDILLNKTTIGNVLFTEKGPSDTYGPVLTIVPLTTLGQKSGTNFQVEFPLAGNNKSGAITSTQHTKLEGIESEATKDEAITTSELNEILV